MKSGSRGQTITGAHYQASFARIGSVTMTFHGRRNTMLIDEAWTLWLALVDHPQNSIKLASNALWFGFSTLVSSFKRLEVGADLSPWRSVTRACWFLPFRILVLLQYCSKPCPLSPLLFNLLVAVPCSDPLLVPNFSPAGFLCLSTPC